MTNEDDDFYLDRVARYVNVGIVLEIARRMAEADCGLICTCEFSPVSTMTVDPPHIVRRDPDCPRHKEGDDDAN
jgi:hypothetical protein